MGDVERLPENIAALRTLACATQRRPQVGHCSRVLQAGARTREDADGLTQQLDTRAAALDKTSRTQGHAQGTRRVVRVSESDFLIDERSCLSLYAQRQLRERGVRAPRRHPRGRGVHTSEQVAGSQK